MTATFTAVPDSRQQGSEKRNKAMNGTDVYFSADVETDGPIPGKFSMLSFALVLAGSFDGRRFKRSNLETCFYRELRPISDNFQPEALRVNGLDRNRLMLDGGDPVAVMTEAALWIKNVAQSGAPILVAYPLSFDWSWLYWYFVNFLGSSPFNHSLCYDVKTAYAVKASVPICESGKSRLLPSLRPQRSHTHHALEDAIEQAEIFAKVFSWEGKLAGTTKTKT